MIEQLKTIREFVDRVPHETSCALGHHADNFCDCGKQETLTALTQLEAMVGAQEPVAKLHDDGYWTPMKTEAGRALNDRLMRAGSPSIEVYTAAPVAQQQGEVVVTWDEQRTRILAVTRQDEEGRVLSVIAEAPAQQPQAECAHRWVGSYAVPDDARCVDCGAWRKQPQARPDFTDEWTGYLKDGETPFERFLRERKDMQSVLKLYQRVLEENERLKAQQPQAEAAPVVDRVYEAAKRLVDHADFQLGGVLSAKSKARDIPSNAASKVKARHLASLRDALAKTPQQAEAVPFNHATQLQIAYVKGLGDGAMQAEAVPSDVARDAVVAEREACAALAQGYAGQVGDVAWAVAAAIRGRGNAAIAQQKGQS